MTKEELFKKYSIDETHNIWDNQIDNWMSVEVYRVMHDGNLPPKDDTSTLWVCQFLDKLHDSNGAELKTLMERKDFGSLYLTSKRMVYSFTDKILEELTKERN